MPADDVEALNGLGVAYGARGRYDDAIRTFERVLALDPTNGLAYQNLASMALRQALATKATPAAQAELQQAEAFARKAIDVDPALPDAHTTLGVILSTAGRKADAIESWKRAVALDGDQFNALYNLWLELAAAGRARRGDRLRPSVRRHCPARVLQTRHRASRAVSEVRSWEVARSATVGVRSGQTQV